jgi:hypothetical protein
MLPAASVVGGAKGGGKEGRQIGPEVTLIRHSRHAANSQALEAELIGLSISPLLDSNLMFRLSPRRPMLKWDLSDYTDSAHTSQFH